MRTLGLNLKEGVVNTREAVEAKNVELSQEYLGLAKSHKKLNGSALAGAVVGLFMRTNVLAMAGGTFYDNYVSKDTGYSTTALVSFERRNDDIYFTNAVQNPKVYNGTSVRDMGPGTKPTGACSSADGGAGNLTGTYNWAYSYVDSANGLETALSPASTNLVLSSKQANLTGITASGDGRHDKKRIYRQGGNWSVWMYVAEINNATTTYTDNSADIDLTTQATNENNEPPPLLSHIVWHGDRFFGWGNPTYPYRLYYSKSGTNSEYWPLTYYDGVGAIDNPIQNCIPYHGELIIVLKKSVEVMTGTEPTTLSFRSVTGIPGTEAGGSVVEGADNFVFYLGDKGIRGVTTATGKPIKWDELKSLFDSYAITGNEQGVFYDDKYFLGLTAKTLIFDHKEPEIGVQVYSDSLIAKCFYRDSNRLLYGDSSGNIYAYQGDPATGTFDYKTVNFDAKQPDSEKVARRIVVDGIVPSRPSPPVTVELWTDGALKVTKLFNETVRNAKEFTFPFTRGKNHQLRIYNTDGVNGDQIKLYNFYIKMELVDGN